MSEESNSNNNIINPQINSENIIQEQQDILNPDFFKSFEPQKKLPEKKSKISNLITFLKENNTYLSSLKDQKKLSSLYDIILTNLIENNNNFVISQINLIEIISEQILNSENNENKNNFITFYKKALPKLFDKLYLQNQKINENLIYIFDNSIKRNVLKLKDYYPLIENICIEEDDEYKTNILNFLYEQINKDENIYMENVPKNIIEAIKKSTNAEDNENLNEISKKIIDILNDRNMKKEINNNKDDNNINSNNNLIDIPNNPLNQQDSKLAFSSFIKKISNAVKKENYNKKLNIMNNNNFENLDNDINMNILNNDNKEEILTNNLMKRNSHENDEILLDTIKQNNNYIDNNQIANTQSNEYNQNINSINTNEYNVKNDNLNINNYQNEQNENMEENYVVTKENKQNFENNIINEQEEKNEIEENYENYVVTKENKDKFENLNNNNNKDIENDNFENYVVTKENKNDFDNNINKKEQEQEKENINNNNDNNMEVNYVVQKGDKNQTKNSSNNSPKKFRVHINRNKNKTVNNNQKEEPTKNNEVMNNNIEVTSDNEGNKNNEILVDNTNIPENIKEEQKAKIPIQNNDMPKVEEKNKEENINKIKDKDMKDKIKENNEKEKKNFTKKDDANKKGYKSRITRSRKLGLMAKPNNKENKDNKDIKNKSKIEENKQKVINDKQEVETEKNDKNEKTIKISVNKTAKIKEKEKEREREKANNNLKEIEFETQTTNTENSKNSEKKIDNKILKENNDKNDFNVEILVKSPGNNKVQIYNEDIPIRKSETVKENIEMPIKNINIMNSIKENNEMPIKNTYSNSIKEIKHIPNNDNLPKNNVEFDEIPINSNSNKNLDEFNMEPNPDEFNFAQKNISIEDFNKKIELAIQQEQQDQMNKENNNSNLKSKASKTDKDDPKFDELKSLLGDEIIENISSPKWEKKKYAFELINNFVNENETNYFNPNNLFEYIKLKLKNFKETNFNIIREAMNIYITMIKKRILTKDNLSLLISNYYEKISDIKLKDNIIEIINTSIEENIIELSSLVSNLISKILKKNNVKILNEYSALFGKMVEDYDIKDLPVKEMINFCKYMAGNSNPQVRTSATNLICVIYKYVGEDVKVLIKDIKESTLKIIEAELEKVVVVEKQDQNKKKKIEKKKTDNTEASVNKRKSIGDLELISPVDISKKISSQLIKDLSEGKWLEKKEACETIEKILNDANMKILPNGLNDLFNLIKTKLSDGNKNLVKILISLVNKFIQALKKEFKPWTKMIALSLIPNLSDKNQAIKNECQLCFEKWVEHVGIETLVIYFPQFLKNDNVEIRIEIMKFIKKYNDKFTKNIAESVYKELMDSLLICLQDRSNNVRNEAEDIIQLSLNYVNIDSYYKKAKDFKPAIAKDLKQILDNIMEKRYLNQKEEYEDNNENINADTNINTLKQQNNQVDTPTYTNINIKEKIRNSIKIKKSNHLDINNNTINNLSNIGMNEDKLNNYNSDYMSGDDETDISQKNTNKDRNITVVNSSNAKKKKNMNKTAEKEKIKKSNSKIIEGNENTNKGPLSSNSTVLRSNKKANNSVEKKPKIQRRNTLTKNTKLNNSIFTSNKLPQNKNKRLELDKKFKFTIDTMTKDDINKLKELAKLLFIEEFSNKILDNDFKKQVEALKKMKNNLDQRENINLYLDNLDIILKILSIKVINVINPSLVKNLFLLLDSLYIIINENEYKVSEIESSIILCILIEKLSLNNNQLKDHLSNLINQYMELFDINKSGLVILNYAINKNNKIKSSVLDLIIELYLNKKINIKSKSYMKILSKYLLVNDNIVKSKCITIFREIQEIIKDEIWNIKEIGEKEREILESNLFNNVENEEENNDNNQDEDENNYNEDENNYGDEENGEENMEDENREEEGYDDNNVNSDEGDNNYDKEENNMNNNYENYNSDNENNNYNNLSNNYNIKEDEENEYNNEVMSDNNNDDDYDENEKYFEDNKMKSNNYYVKTDNKIDDKRKIDKYNQKKQIFYKNNDIISKIHKLQNTKNQIENNYNNIKREDINKNQDNKFTLPKKIIVKQKKSGGFKKQKNNNTTNNNINNKTNNKNLNINSNNINNNYINNNIINNYYNNNNNSMPNNDLSISLYNDMNLNNNQNNNMINNNLSSNSIISSEKELIEIMNNLFSEDESEKMSTIIIIHEILCSKYQQNKFILIPNIDSIIKIIIQITHDLFDCLDNLNNKIIPLKFAKYLVTILCKLTSNKELIIHISYKVLYDLCYELLNYLLINGLDKIGTNQEGNIIFKSLNSAMLRVIENCDTTSVILALLEIIKQNQSNNNSGLLCNLAIKCLLKTTQNIQSIINNIQLDKILLQMHLLTFNFDRLSSNNMEKNSQSDIMIIRFIKNFIIDIVKIKKTDILEDYNKSIGNNQYKDKYIYNWIRSTLESIGCMSGDENDNDSNENNINSDDNEVVKTGSNIRSTSTNINKNRINNSDKKRDSTGFIAEANKTVSSNLNKKSAIIVKKHGNNSINNRYNNINSHNNVHSSVNINVTKSSILGSSNISANNNKILIQKNNLKSSQANKGNNKNVKKKFKYNK